MKKLIFTIVVIVLSSNLLISQRPTWQIYAGSGYVFPSNLLFQQGGLRTNGSAEVNLNFQYNYGYSAGVGVDYTFVPTSVEFTPDVQYSNDYSYQKIDLNIHFISARWAQYFLSNSSVNPFFDAGIGLNVYAPQNVNIQSSTHFLMTFGGGCEFRIADPISIRLRGGVKLPTYGANPGLYCGIGNYAGLNCGLALGGSALTAYWDLGGGLTFNF